MLAIVVNLLVVHTDGHVVFGTSTCSCANKLLYPWAEISLSLSPSSSFILEVLIFVTCTYYILLVVIHVLSRFWQYVHRCSNLKQYAAPLLRLTL